MRAPGFVLLRAEPGSPVNAIDGRVRLRAPEDGENRWPANAVCDLSVISAKGASAAVYLSESDVRTLIRQLDDQIGGRRERPATR